MNMYLKCILTLYFQGAGVLPVTAHQCGLITKSDAERLAAFLNTSRITVESRLNGDLNDVDEARVVVHVQHECFGKAYGKLYPVLYRSPTAKCISCNTCSKYSIYPILIHLK